MDRRGNHGKFPRQMTDVCVNHKEWTGICQVEGEKPYLGLFRRYTSH